jgi:hypothetical protein
MGLQKGDRINPNGRPKGAVNRSTAEIRKAFQLLVSENLERLQSDLDALEPEKRISYIIKMAEFIIPKLQSVSLEDQFEIEYKHLNALLSSAPDQAIEAITMKLLTIKSQQI